MLAGATTPAFTLAASPQRAAVTGLSVTDGDNAGEVDVAWDAHPASAQDYRLAWTPRGRASKAGPTQTGTTTPPGPSHTVNGLDEGVTYRFRVKARFSQSPNSNWSAVVTLTTAQTANAQETPAQVRDANAAQQTGQTPVTVSWSASEGATKYQVERNNDPPTSSDPVITYIDNNGTSHQDSNITYDTRYRYRVRAGNAAGYGTWSRAARITTNREPGTPAAPGSFAAVEEDAGTVETSWTAPSGTESITGYRVYRYKISWGTETLLATLDSSVTSYDDATVEPEIYYSFWVRAYNDTGASPNSRRESLTTQVQTQDVPGTPGRPTLTEDTPGDVVVTWTAPTDGADPTQYKVFRQKVGDTENQVIATLHVPTLTYTDDTVEEEIWYYYQVRAINDAGESTASRSRPIKTTVQTPGVPNAPTGLDVTEDTAGEVVLTWTAPADGADHTGYNVYRKKLAGADTLLGSTTADVTTYTDSAVEAETWYDYRVRATNAAGNSSESGLETILTQAQTDGAPPAPEDTEADQ